MKAAITTVWILSFAISFAMTDAWYERWEFAGKTWYEKWNNVLKSVDSIPLNEKIDLLGKAVALGTDTRMDDQKREIFNRAQRMMLAIPGHSEYYRDRINNARALMEKELAGGNGTDYATARHALADEVNYGFETLSQLPSVENVRVLGEFLFDERDYVKVPLENNTERERYQSIKHSPVFHKAANALDTLPIVAKPMKAPRGGYDCPEDTTPWRQWYQEIKDGKRTFRFEGDPTEYDLNGPAPKEKLERIALHQRMESDREARRGKSTGATKDAETSPTNAEISRKPAIYASIAALIALLVSTAWYFRRKQRAAP